ncbi:MAG: ArsR family transcriptional regulator [Candidatus Hodarchaeales archaeon]|jgi:DNA-binding transcriptional ArsR family regulator
MTESFFPIKSNQAMILSHEMRWKIMKLLLQEEKVYAKQLAEILKVSESKIHYHLAQLRRAGLIKLVGFHSIKQGRAKLLKPVASNFILTLMDQKLQQSDLVFNKIFVNRFYKSGMFNTQIVVGSSVPHGRYDAISRDGHLVGDLCWYLGAHTSLTQLSGKKNLVITDLEYNEKKTKNISNLILIGGHITNELTAKYNTVLKNRFNIYFTENRIISKEREYFDPEDGLLAVFKNPNDLSKWILILAGVRSLGTRSAIYSIVNDCSEVFSNKDEFVSVIKGEINSKIQITGVKRLFIEERKKSDTKAQ